MAFYGRNAILAKSNLVVQGAFETPTHDCSGRRSTIWATEPYLVFLTLYNYYISKVPKCQEKYRVFKNFLKIFFIKTKKDGYPIRLFLQPTTLKGLNMNKQTVTFLHLYNSIFSKNCQYYNLQNNRKMVLVHQYHLIKFPLFRRK